MNNSHPNQTLPSIAWPFSLLTVISFVMAWSFINPYEQFTWFLEAFPVIIALPLLIITYPRFQLTQLLYTLIAIHCIILLIGGHYTYAEVPLFNTIRDTYDLSRNHYDRIGHFAQGFIPAIFFRELLLRTSPLKGKMAQYHYYILRVRDQCFL